MKRGFLIMATLVMAVPLSSLAALPDVIKTKADVQTEIKKQLNESIESRDNLIILLRGISSRVAAREQILLDNGSINDAAKEEIDLNLKEANDALTSAGQDTDGVLPGLAEAILASDKTERAAGVKEFRKEADKIRAELFLARNLIIESINLIKETE